MPTVLRLLCRPVPRLNSAPRTADGGVYARLGRVAQSAKSTRPQRFIQLVPSMQAQRH